MILSPVGDKETDMAKKSLGTIRDKQITRRRLISAVGSLLAREGFKGVGVNAVAREAGVDKKLIYRYFGGLPGLIAAFGKEEDFWPSVLELAGNDIQSFAGLPLDARLSGLTANFIAGIRKRPLTQAIMAWEMVEQNELTTALESVREQRIMEFFRMFFGREQADVDLQAIIMLVGAAVSYLVVRANHIHIYGGIRLDTDEGWQRIENSINEIIKGVLVFGRH